MKRLLMVAVLLSLLPGAFNAEDGEGAQYMTGCCPYQALGPDAATGQVRDYASARTDVCGDYPDGPVLMPCLVESVSYGGMGCCIPYGGLDTDEDRREYAAANAAACGSWPEGAPVEPCTAAGIPGGDPVGETTVESGPPRAPPPDWVPLALLAVFTGLGVLIIFFLLSYLVDAEQMRAMAISEMWQVVITGVMIAGFVGAQAFATEVFAPAFGEAFAPEGETGGTHLDYAVGISESMVDYKWATLREYADGVVIPMGSLASISGNCWLFGVAFSYAGCASINVPFSSASLAARTMATAVLALNSQLMLLRIAGTFFFPVLLPIGLFLRTFHVTRGTGGFLIAFAVAFYFIYPLGVLITKGLYDEGGAALAGSLGRDEEVDYGPEYPGIDWISADESWNFGSMLSSFDVPAECDPFKTYDYPETDEVEGYGYTESQINKLLDEDLMDPLLYIFMIGGIFTPALNMLVALSIVRPLTRLFGTEVDVSALARVS